MGKGLDTRERDFIYRWRKASHTRLDRIDLRAVATLKNLEGIIGSSMHLTDKRVFRLDITPKNCTQVRLIPVRKEGDGFSGNWETYVKPKFLVLVDIPRASESDIRIGHKLLKQLLTDESYQFADYYYMPNDESPDIRQINYMDSQTDMHIDDEFKPCGVHNFNTGYTNKPAMKEGTNMLDTVINTNRKAAKEAATLVATRKVSQVLTAKIKDVAPESVKPFVDTAIGAVVLANIAAIALSSAGNGLSSTNFRTATKIVDAMNVNAMTDVMTSFDLAGILEAILSMPEISDITDDFANDDL